jgi:hypothetical protein
VRVSDAPGTWYVEAMRRALRGLPLPVLVTRDVQSADLSGFSYPPAGEFFAQPPPGGIDKTIPLSRPQLRLLQVLARVKEGKTIELASLAGYSLTSARHTLEELTALGFAEKALEKQAHVWKIKKTGKSRALRSWGVPPGKHYTAYKEGRKTSERHKRTAHLWQAWIERAWPEHAVIWAGWSEVGLPGRRNPDGLAWGILDGHETLFWLEVESGHTAAAKLRPKMARRFDRALTYARSLGVHLLYAVLGPDRVIEESVRVFRNVPPDAAVVMGNWIAFGRLPFAVWGTVRMAKG